MVSPCTIAAPSLIYSSVQRHTSAFSWRNWEKTLKPQGSTPLHRETLLLWLHFARKQFHIHDTTNISDKILTWNFILLNKDLPERECLSKLYNVPMFICSCIGFFPPMTTGMYAVLSSEQYKYVLQNLGPMSYINLVRNL